MSDWSRQLADALASGEPEAMRRALSAVPQGALRQAIPLLDRMADDGERAGRLEEALFYRDCLVEAAPERAAARLARGRLRLRLGLHEEALGDAGHLLDNASEDAAALRLAGEAHEALGDLREALAAYRRAQAATPDPTLAERIRTLETEQARAEVLRRALDPEAAAEQPRIELPPPPDVRFDPAIRDDPSMPADAEAFRIDGLVRHLGRYGSQASPRSTLMRLRDLRWCEAWDRALAGTAGARVRFAGSELGVLALRALHHGAAHALCVERHALDARIATGMVQKHFLGAWHALHGDVIRQWSDDERRDSFDAFTRAIDIAAADAAAAHAPCDVVVFPGIDHTLLGTGLVPAIRAARTADGGVPRVMPARATLHAMPIQWRYPDDEAGAGFDLTAVDRLRWSAYPQALELGPECWTALAAPVCVGTLDFAAFEAGAQEFELPALCDGRIDAVLTWFDLDLDGTSADTRISSAPESGLRCLRPAVHAADGLPVRAGEPLRLRIECHETRLHARTVPAPSRLRANTLPSWYVPMLCDARRNGAYRHALRGLLRMAPSRLALDIGAGTGLLSMLAAEAGAAHVIGCEQLPAIAAVGRETLAANGYAGRVTLVEKDCRALEIPGDLPERADLALFELFDCSLIGEGVLHFLAHAREHLLRPDARFLPAGARLRAQVVEYRFDRVLGVDAGLLNPYLASLEFVNVDARTLDCRPLSAPFDLFDFDFATAGPEPQELALEPVATADGTASALLFWFDLRLDGETVLSNAPDAPPLHWHQGLQFLPEARVAAGSALPLVAKHNGSALRVQWRPDGLPADAFSRLPRLDPNWLAANAELDQRTGQLLQHCAQDPDEYRKVAAIAQRLAVDPARHGLDPVIAERFLRMFLRAPD